MTRLALIRDTTAADAFTRADPLYRAAAATSVRPHAAFYVGKPRPVTLADLIVALPRLVPAALATAAVVILIAFCVSYAR